MNQVRCAVYTRKSSEEGLEQAFNSLDAQREAGLDYIKSQKHQGWVAIPTAYDDGGYSGGSTDRPGLQKLLADIERGRVDVVLVYKVDRLSRSLTDFARLMQVFDQHQVSFVSVTQQFNTTTSMGRLTLNMLLSFAQFEREVAGERIRDKIAATRRKGVWVCGQPPLGYAIAREGDPEFTAGLRALRIVPDEADLVRAVYTGYLDLGSLVKLAQRLHAAGHRTKTWEGRAPRARGGRPLTTSYLYRILTNPLYIGQIAHKRGKGKDAVIEINDGNHEPIIDRATWDRVRAAMDSDTKRSASVWTHTHLLKGKLRTSEGYAISPGSVHRPRSSKDPDEGSHRILYYTSQKALKHGYASCPIKSLNAQHLDDLVRALMLDHFEARGLRLQDLGAAVRDRWLREAIVSVEVGPSELIVHVDDAAAARGANDLKARPSTGGRPAPRTNPGPLPTCPYRPEVIHDADAPRSRLRLEIQIKRHDGRRMLVAGDGGDLLMSFSPSGVANPRPHLVRAVAQAHVWKREMLASPKHGTLSAIAARSGLTPPRVNHLLPLATLSPDIIRTVLAGTLPTTVTLGDLVSAAAHPRWDAQARHLGLVSGKARCNR